MASEFSGCVSDESCVCHVPIFRDLKQSEVLLLDTAVQSRHYRKGELIFQEGEESDSLYIIHQGVVKIYNLSDEGKEHILRFLFAGDFGGQLALFKEDIQYTNAEAVEDAVVCRIYRKDLKTILGHNPEMAYRFLQAMSDRLRDADEWTGSLNLLDADRRIAKVLLNFGTRGGQNPGFHKLPVAKKDLAALLGIAPETLSRKLAYFDEQGWISLSGKKGVEIKNVNALQKIAKGMPN